MAELNPPYFLNARTDHSAQVFRNMIDALSDKKGGVVGLGDLAVSISTGLTVSIAAGAAFIRGTAASGLLPQGAYYVLNDAAALITLDTAHATNPRIDTIVAQIEDAQYAGSVNAWKLAKVTGTPAGSPSAPTLPAHSIALADCRVNAAQTTIASVTDRRTWARGMNSGLTVLAESVLTGDAASIVFSNIPQTFRHLRLVYQARSAAAGVSSFTAGIRINGDTSAIYHGQRHYNSASTSIATIEDSGQTFFSIGDIPQDGGGAGFTGSGVVDLPDYARSTWHKTMVGVYMARVNDGAGGQGRNQHRSGGGSWANTAPITSLTFFQNGAGNIKAGSVVTLYGLGVL